MDVVVLTGMSSSARLELQKSCWIQNDVSSTHFRVNALLDLGMSQSRVSLHARGAM